VENFCLANSLANWTRPTTIHATVSAIAAATLHLEELEERKEEVPMAVAQQHASNFSPWSAALILSEAW